MSKILVAYFSASGVTARAAQAIAAAVGGDLYEIAPAQPYTAADLDWTNKQSRSSLEMGDTACRPALAAAVENVEQYDTVFVGFPIWWGIEPRAVDTFLESCDFSGKAMVPFATSGGSAMPPAERHLREQYPALTWEAGQLVTPRTAGAWAQSVLGR